MGLLQKLGLVAADEKGGALAYEKMKWTIAKVDIVYEHKTLKIEKRADGRPYFIVKLKNVAGAELILKQLLFLNKDGSARSPISREWQNKDGVLQPSSMMYDIKVAIEAEMTSEQIEKWLALSWDDETRWIGKSFLMDTKSGTAKASGEPFYILGTSEQKYYDHLSEQYRAATGEWESNRSILRDFATPNTKFKTLDEVTVPEEKKENKAVNPADDDLPF